ncbi:four helix bundle protein [Raineya sp.]|jgi:four helix bundle protein
MHNYKELKVWQKSMNLVTRVYQLTENFPSDEKFGLVSQIRRSAISIPSNIAEGAGRNTTKDFVHFLSVANASCCELNTQLIITQNLLYIESTSLTQLEKDIDEIQKMIFNLKKVMQKM